jgi:hypothetical protein
LSGWIWAGIWIFAGVLALIFCYLAYRSWIKAGKTNLAIVLVLIAFLSLAGAAALSGMSYYYNYTHSSSYNMAKKNLKIEYDMKQERTIRILDFQGKEIYKYTGSFSFKLKGRGLDLTDNKTGNKISIYMGDNDSFIVEDAEITKSK